MEKWVVMGRVGGAFGVRGWLKILSDTQPRAALLDYSPWWLRHNHEWVPFDVLDGAAHGKGLIARLEGVTDRDAAEKLHGAVIAVHRQQLEPLPEGEYYWADLIGMRVTTVAGHELGRVENLLETGANDVLVVRSERERLIPYLRPQVIKSIDLEAGVMCVDWDPEF